MDYWINGLMDEFLKERAAGHDGATHPTINSPNYPLLPEQPSAAVP
jgi:hypothetical protein